MRGTDDDFPPSKDLKGNNDDDADHPPSGDFKGMSKMMIISLQARIFKAPTMIFLQAKIFLLARIFVGLMMIFVPVRILMGRIFW